MNTKLSIRSIAAATDDQWDAIWKNCDYATYFHSRQWAQIWNHTSNQKIISDPMLITFSDNRHALLPWSHETKQKGRIKTYLSSIAGTFGGWISDQPLDKDHAAVLADLIAKHYYVLLQNPYNPIADHSPLKKIHDDVTYVINLSAGYDAVYKKCSKSNKDSTKKALRNKVYTQEGARPDDWKSYYALYQATLNRWGHKATYSYKWRLFEFLQQMNSPYIKLWASWLDGKMIAGVLYFYAKTHVVYWHGAVDDVYSKFRPVNLLTRSPYYLFAAYRKLVERKHIRPDAVRFIFAGAATPDDKQLAETFRVAEITEFRGYLNHEKSVELLYEADVLFLPLHELDDGCDPLIVPGKTYEYLAARRSILACVPMGDACDFVLKSGLGCICEPSDIEQISKTLLNLIEQHRSKRGILLHPDIEFINKFERKQQAKELSNVFDFISQ